MWVELDAARALARRLMNRHGLEEWEFGFDRARRRLGACWPLKRKITLSREFVLLNEQEQVEDIILHEIAHALTPGAGHGARFKAMARKLGCTASACVVPGSVTAPEAKVTLVCPHCEGVWRRYRRPAKKLVCVRCARKLGREVQPLSIRAR